MCIQGAIMKMLPRVPWARTCAWTVDCKVTCQVEWQNTEEVALEDVVATLTCKHKPKAICAPKVIKMNAAVKASVHGEGSTVARMQHRNGPFGCTCQQTADVRDLLIFELNLERYLQIYFRSHWHPHQM